MDDLKIGMGFSGGGYRAATFDLGSLSFLDYIKLDGVRSLLDCVVVLTSVSGGTITALKYMLGKARGQDVSEIVKDLYEFLNKEDLVEKALQQLSDQRANREVSSIKIMADIYDTCLFDNATFGELIDNFNKIPVKDYTALATDFNNSLPFRFRIIDVKSPEESSKDKVIGNQKDRISLDVMRYITLGEALACSSCFPSGFEPMMFPDDFKLSQREDIVKTINKKVAIMDGGVVDNQGIRPISLAEERLFKFRSDKSRTDKALDLVILSDVSSPYMHGYMPSEQIMPEKVGKLTIGRLRNYGLITMGVFAALFVLALVLGSGFWTGVMSVLLALSVIGNLIGAWSKRKMYSAIAKTFVGNKAMFLSHLKFATLESMIMNRAKSVVMMTSEVFLKQLRKLGYNALYDDEGWKNRLISNAIYELRPNEKWQSKADNGNLPYYLMPSNLIQENSIKATSMGTTLWFTSADKQEQIPQALMATGQYTMCYNLLDYIYKIEKSPENLNDNHKLIIGCKEKLMEAWKKFQEDPQWMVRSMLK